MQRLGRIQRYKEDRRRCIFYNVITDDPKSKEMHCNTYRTDHTTGQGYDIKTLPTEKMITFFDADTEVKLYKFARRFKKTKTVEEFLMTKYVKLLRRLPYRDLSKE